MARRQQQQKFVVAVGAGVLARLDAFVLGESPEALEWWGEQLGAVRKISDPTLRRQARSELALERDRRRREGLHNDTSSAVISHQLLVELEARGWREKSWGPVPPGYASLGGHPRGVGYGSRGELPERLVVSLPEDVADLLRRAVWGTSKSTIRRLEALAKVAEDRRLSKAEYDEKTQLQKKIVTVGDVIRAAARRVEDR
ncbi:hypothetical protein BS329_38880 [Amycolatopsis coloradensis]|uniref:Uncharacterized protein n=1 Tax=Amycolatopsis coloradensis TaxID=76021 RepID=A0A1R0KES4_9PSEU|nr:hypothetical protein [Amycolatopsis coloradensis]OLZ43625.1 hypothetical protein BS329_38880 [Amycolatopsis coloradensis]